MKAERQHKVLQAGLIQPKRDGSKLSFVDNRPQMVNQANTIDSIQAISNNNSLLTSMGAEIGIKNSTIFGKTIQRTITNEDETECVLDKFNRRTECVQTLALYFYTKAYRENRYKHMPLFDTIFNEFDYVYESVIKPGVIKDENVKISEITNIAYEEIKEKYFLDKFYRRSECVQSVTACFYKKSYEDGKYKIMPHFDDVFDVFNKEYDLILEYVLDNMTLPEIADLIYDKTKSIIDVLAIIEEDGIISSELKENGFSELNYKGVQNVLAALCFDLSDFVEKKTIEKARKILDSVSELEGFKVVKDLLKSKNEDDKYDFELMCTASAEIAAKDENEIRKIIPNEIIRELDSYITGGNCGEIANFIYGEKLNGDYKQEVDETYFNHFLEVIDSDVPEEKVRLIRATSNIGHDFTLAEYKIHPNSEILVEIIQAWEGMYSVKDWFAKNSSVLTKTELKEHLNILHKRDPLYESSLKRLFNAVVGEKSKDKKQADMPERQAYIPEKIPFAIKLFISKDEDKSPHDFALALLNRPPLR